MTNFKLLAILFLIFIVSISGFSCSLPSDKLKHIAISFSISLFLYPHTGYPENVLITLGIGIGKEIYDFVSGSGHADMQDIVADLYGALISLKAVPNRRNIKFCVGTIWVF